MLTYTCTCTNNDRLEEIYPYVHNRDASITINIFFLPVHLLVLGYTKFHQNDVYCTPSTKIIYSTEYTFTIYDILLNISVIL